MYRGGNWNNGADAGVFYLNGNNAPSNTNSNLGSRLLIPYPKLRVVFSSPLGENFAAGTRPSKPDMDLMFVSGVNHMYFHGTTYSPAEAAWPGWKFYASIDMSPTNNIWRDAPAFFDYVTRCQSFLQMGQPDNDFLVYLPVYDMWDEQDGRLLLFDIHKMAKRAPRFIEAVHRIYSAGYGLYF